MGATHCAAVERRITVEHVPDVQEQPGVSSLTEFQPVCGGQIQPLIRLDPVAAADGPVVLIKDQRLNSLVAPVPVGTGIGHEPVDREGAHIPAKLEPEPLLDLGEAGIIRSEEHKSELKSLMRISYDVFCLKNKNK